LVGATLSRSADTGQPAPRRRPAEARARAICAGAAGVPGRAGSGGRRALKRSPRLDGRVLVARGAAG